MNRSGTILQIALVAGALLLGVLLDRFLLGHRAVAQRDGTAATLGSNPVSANFPAPVSGRGNATHAASAASEIAALPAATTLDSVLAERDPRQRLRDLQALIDNLPVTGYADALQRLRKIVDSNERELASRLLVAQWVQIDPDGALQFAAGARGYEYLAEDVFRGLAAQDFAAAVTRAQGMPGSDMRYRAFRGVLAVKAETDPRAALELAATFGEFRGSEPLANTIYRQWATTDPLAAAVFATTQSDGAGERWGSPVSPVLDTWTRQDPAAAANWALSLQDSQTQTRTLAQVTRQWSRDDPTAVANWIYGLESGASRDAAIAGLAQALVARDPQTALGWIGTMGDDATRLNTLRRLSGTVLWRDPENGAAMLQAAGLPADQIRDNRRRGP